ncbi:MULTISPECIES: 4-phosphoerythronate dehydrogenase [unclassified Carboxylicivirga]|uniref:4-phosphoerythronate dehydrogenase n=1 Tax=Carboxylicivirga TaxID=1628153 RepID=UPI003D340582
MKIVADNKIPFLKGVLEPLAEVVYAPGGEISKALLKDADALITRTRTLCNRHLLEGTKVQLIASATIGYDHIDADWCAQHNIAWTNAPGCNAGSVKQYIGAVLALLVSEKCWQLQGKTMVVVGVGNVGRKVSAMAKAIGMQVYEVDPPRARAEGSRHFHALEAVVSKADIITFHTPLISEGKDKTYHLCDKHLLSKMKQNAVLINSSRGEVIDGTALKAALQKNEIGAAVLDVWENEPNIDPTLLELVWVATPHIAGYSQDGKARGTALSVQALSRFFHLGRDNWEPGNLPAPEQEIVPLHEGEEREEEQIARAILHTYPLRNDDANLRNQPEDFENLRGSYPVRREFHAYTLPAAIRDTALITKLKALGFTNY